MEETHVLRHTPIIIIHWFSYNCVQETLRTALAMGVDRAIHVQISDDDYASLQPFHVSKLLAKVATEEKTDLLIVGKQVQHAKTTLSFEVEHQRLNGFSMQSQ